MAEAYVVDGVRTPFGKGKPGGALAGEQAKNIARNAVLAAGWPVHVPGTTIDRQRGSSQQAVHFAAQRCWPAHTKIGRAHV